MAVFRKRPRKWLWMTLVITLLVAGGGIALISLSTFGETSDASTEVAGKDGTSGAADNGNDPEDAADAGAEAEGEEESGQAKGAEGEDGEKDEPDPVPVEIAQVGSGPINSYLSTTANLEAENHAEILAEIEGLVLDLKAEEGDRVRKGEVLAVLDEGDRKIRLEKAVLKVRNEKTNFDRARQMLSNHLISQEEFERIELAFQVAQQEREEADYLLSRTEIRAPFSGVVAERFIKEGARVKPADPLFALVSYNPLVAKIYLPEKDILDLDVGDEVMLALNAVQGTRFPGRISLISPVVDPTTGTVKVTVEVSRVPDNVRPGSFVTVNIVRETHVGALQVPREAVIRDLQENFVYVVEGEEAKKRKVEIGFEENGHVEIVSGLTGGERIVTVGQGGLKDGTRIEIIGA